MSLNSYRMDLSLVKCISTGFMTTCAWPSPQSFPEDLREFSSNSPTSNNPKVIKNAYKSVCVWRPLQQLVCSVINSSQHPQLKLLDSCTHRLQNWWFLFIWLRLLLKLYFYLACHSTKEENLRSCQCTNTNSFCKELISTPKISLKRLNFFS